MQRSESRSGIHSKGLIITSPDDEGCLYKGGEENRSRGIFKSAGENYYNVVSMRKGAMRERLLFVNFPARRGSD